MSSHRQNETYLGIAVGWIDIHAINGGAGIGTDNPTGACGEHTVRAPFTEGHVNTAGSGVGSLPMGTPNNQRAYNIPGALPGGWRDFLDGDYPTKKSRASEPYLHQPNFNLTSDHLPKERAQRDRNIGSVPGANLAVDAYKALNVHIKPVAHTNTHDFLSTNPSCDVMGEWEIWMHMPSSGIGKIKGGGIRGIGGGTGIWTVPSGLMRVFTDDLGPHRPRKMRSNAIDDTLEGNRDGSASEFSEITLAANPINIPDPVTSGQVISNPNYKPDTKVYKVKVAVTACDTASRVSTEIYFDVIRQGRHRRHLFSTIGWHGQFQARLAIVATAACNTCAIDTPGVCCYGENGECICVDGMDRNVCLALPSGAWYPTIKDVTLPGCDPLNP